MGRLKILLPQRKFWPPRYVNGHDEICWDCTFMLVFSKKLREYSSFIKLIYSDLVFFHDHSRYTSECTLTFISHIYILGLLFFTGWNCQSPNLPRSCHAKGEYWFPVILFFHFIAFVVRCISSRLPRCR